MILQIIDGISYVNGVKLEIKTIPESDIAKSLHIINKEIIEKQNSINKLLQQRDERIIHGKNNNFSTITLDTILNITRQRRKEISNTYK